MLQIRWQIPMHSFTFWSGAHGIFCELTICSTKGKHSPMLKRLQSPAKAKGRERVRLRNKALMIGVEVLISALAESAIESVV